MSRRGPKDKHWLLNLNTNSVASISSWANLLYRQRGVTYETAYRALRLVAVGYAPRVTALGIEWLAPHGAQCTKESVTQLRAENGVPLIDDTIPRCLECGVAAECRGHIAGVRELWFLCAKHCTHARCLSMDEAITKHAKNPYGE